MDLQAESDAHVKCAFYVAVCCALPLGQIPWGKIQTLCIDKSPDIGTLHLLACEQSIEFCLLLVTTRRLATMRRGKRHR